MSNESLCQDCLRPMPTNPYNNEGVCSECGGGTCNCADCQQTLTLLRRGERSAQKLGIQSNLRDWSETGGATVL